MFLPQVKLIKFYNDLFGWVLILPYTLVVTGVQLDNYFRKFRIEDSLLVHDPQFSSSSVNPQPWSYSNQTFLQQGKSPVYLLEINND